MCARRGHHVCIVRWSSLCVYTMLGTSSSCLLSVGRRWSLVVNVVGAVKMCSHTSHSLRVQHRPAMLPNTSDPDMCTDTELPIFGLGPHGRSSRLFCHEDTSPDVSGVYPNLLARLAGTEAEEA